MSMPFFHMLPLPYRGTLVQDVTFSMQRSSILLKPCVLEPVRSNLVMNGLNVFGDDFGLSLEAFYLFNCCIIDKEKSFK